MMPSEEKRIAAANKTIVLTREKLVEQNQMRAESASEEALNKRKRRAVGVKYSDESSSDDDYGDRMVSAVRAGAATHQSVDLVEQYIPFILALPECPMNLGFHVLGVTANAEKCCYCPCGPKLSTWRNKFFGMAEEGHRCDTGSRMAPSGFIDHLEQYINPPGTFKAPCLYHWIVHTYLVCLYKDFWGSGLSHKAFYKLNDTSYRRADAAERNEQQRYVTTIGIEFEFLLFLCHVSYQHLRPEQWFFLQHQNPARE
jgi:hypothetical protein